MHSSSLPFQRHKNPNCAARCLYLDIDVVYSISIFYIYTGFSVIVKDSDDFVIISVPLFCFFFPCALQHRPPLVVADLFEDIKDGIKLLALLEVLSGQKLVRSGDAKEICFCYGNY